MGEEFFGEQTFYFLSRQPYSAIFAVFSAVLGAIVGSFLNACIHRMPRNVPLGNPRRSFCPACNHTIPWYYNLPIVSWLWLRGRCAYCKAKISIRYWIVELLTAALFLLAWQTFPPGMALAYWVFLALLIAATFIDLEHMIIPDEITIGGTFAGIAASVFVPSLVGAETRWAALGWSLLGAVIGFFIVWGIVEAGKLAFGKVRHRFEQPETFCLKIAEDQALLRLGEEELPLEEIFSRENDELVLDCIHLLRGGQKHESAVLRVRYNKLFLNDEEIALGEVGVIEGQVSSVVIPREAMGFGDVKFMACLGAFTGWQGVLFTLCAASLVGSIVGIATLIASRGKGGAKVPFGPFLAFGSALWIFYGKEIVTWYLAWSLGTDHTY